MGEWDFFQIEPGTIGDDWAVGSSKQQLRAPDMKMSNFGALNFGARMSTDYTRTVFDFEAKELMFDPTASGTVVGMSSWAAEKPNENPYVWGSTVKTVRDDQFVRMGMYMGGTDQYGLNNPASTQIAEPKFDVMDTNMMVPTTVSGIADYATKNYPTEGWRSFGGKYDFHYVYDGTLR